LGAYHFGGFYEFHTILNYLSDASKNNFIWVVRV